MSNDAAEVHIKIEDGVGWLTFDHQARLNSMTIEMWQGVPTLCGTLESDPAVRVVVLRGAGERAFVAGADISQFSDQRTPEKADQYGSATAAASAAVEAISKPVIAMIHGFCIGGGLALALAADIRYAADDAKFALPPAKLGIGYAADGVADLINLVGPSVTKEIIYTADLFDGPTALRWGLINQLIAKDDLEEFVRRQCTTMAKRAPLSQRAAKLAVRDYHRPENSKGDGEVEAAIEDCTTSDDYAEGVAAFLGKRPPVFKGE